MVDPAGPALEELQGVELEFTLREDLDPERIDVEGGTPIAIRREGLDGALRVAVSSETAIFRGWAADLAARRAPDRVVVFVGEASVYTGRTGNSDRRLLRERYGVEDAGFRIELPVGLVPRRGEGPSVRVFAVYGDVAAELPYRGGDPWRAT